MTVQKVIQTAKKYIGTTEKPANSNNVKFNTDYWGHPVEGANFPWCATFVWDIIEEAGGSNLYFGDIKSARKLNAAYCPNIYQLAKDKGQLIISSEKFKAGDIVLFVANGGKSPKHVGIAVKDEVIDTTGRRTIETVEGNTSSDNKGDQTNGGGVFLRTRPIGHGRTSTEYYIFAAFRPKYEEELYKQVQNLGEEEMKYHTLKDVPDWALETINKLITKQAIKGVGQEPDGTLILDIETSTVKTLVILDRLGKL